MKRLISKAENSGGFWFLLLSSFFFFLLRLPSLFEPYWYGDEGIYQVLGIAIRHGRLLYRDIWDNKPPLLYILYGMFNSDQFAVRLVSLVFGVLSMIAFYFLTKTLFQNKPRLTYWITGLFGLLFGLPLIEGNIANAENFMLLPTILASLLLLRSTKYRLHNTNYLILAGGLVSAAFLFKVVAIFDFAAFFLFLLFINAPPDLSIKNWKALKSFLISEVKNFTPFLIGFLSPILLVALFFLFKGAIKDFLAASFVQNVGYVGYGNKLIIPQGLLILKLLILALLSLFLFAKRSKFSRTFIFISLWFAFSLFNSFFSQRPYTHYLLVLIPSFCFFVGLFFEELKLRKLTGALIIISLLLIIKNFWFYGKTIYYYQNFISFVTNQKSVISYRAFFDSKTPRDYQLVQFIKIHTKPGDNIFIWGNNAQVYALSNKLPPGRYAVAYHIAEYKDGIQNTKNGIDRNKPKLIIVMPDVPQLPFPLLNYKVKSNIENVLIYERIF